MMGACCPGKSKVKKIRVGGLDIGIAELDSIINRAIEMTDKSEEEIRRYLLEQVKIYNYVPNSAEKEYEDAIWKEFMSKKILREGAQQ